MKYLVLATAATLCVACTPDHMTAPAQAPTPIAPLVIVDGKELPGATVRALEDLAIERVEVVKGSAALALYGVRARSGVILVTTKRAR